MKVAELKKRFGTVNFEGIEFVLTQNAYFWSACDNKYSASAIREDEIDEDGEPINKYIVFWDILDEYNSSLQDEGDACDWEHPVEIVLV